MSLTSQNYKSIYFATESSEQPGKTVTIAFNKNEEAVFGAVKNLTSTSIREIININDFETLEKKSAEENRSISNFIKCKVHQNINKYKDTIKSRDITFVGSREIPFQRWYPYIEGYSPDFIYSLIDNYNIENTATIYDPFVGTGTTIFSSDKRKIRTVYSEVNPLLQFLVKTKIKVLKLSHTDRHLLSDQLREALYRIQNELHLQNENPVLKKSYQDIFGGSKYFSNKTLSLILKYKSLVNEMKLENELLSDVLSLAAVASLIPSSFLKKAGDVRFKTETEEKEIIDFSVAVSNKIEEIIEDVSNTEHSLNRDDHTFLISNAKYINRLPSQKIDAVITSPPYLNGTNYFRNTKVELWFLEFIKEKKDLRILRDSALTSAINDVKKESNDYDFEILECSPLLKKTIEELTEKQYDSRLSPMVTNYFEEMYVIFSGLKHHLRTDSKILIDLGDSIFAGVHVPTDDILIEVLSAIGYKFEEKVILRKRRSRNQQILSQVLLNFSFSKTKKLKKNKFFRKSWEAFKTDLPHQQEPFSKRNWGHKNHSMCSYQGKLKPSIAHHLVKTFVPEGGSVLDPFSGVGTIPFEAALNGKLAYGIDISKSAYYISSAKVGVLNKREIDKCIRKLEKYICSNKISKKEINSLNNFGYNKTLPEYFQENTFKEILLARKYFLENPPESPSQMAVISSLLHILHGNRPYALSRRSHPIVPYAPTGEYVYKNVIQKLKDKISLILREQMSEEYKEGKIFHQDILNVWPQEINNLDAIITSPPFFGSTKFYSANWMRIWFAGWEENDFKNQIKSYIEEKQKKSFNVYEDFFRQSRERLKKDGVLVLHLGKSKNCDMAKVLAETSKKWFEVQDIFDESVIHCESHGFKDKGGVTSHQYLVLQ